MDGQLLRVRDLLVQLRKSGMLDAVLELPVDRVIEQAKKWADHNGLPRDLVIYGIGGFKGRDTTRRRIYEVRSK